MRNLILSAFFAVTVTSVALAEDFRVVTTIHEGETKRRESTTVFYQGRVYDVSHPEKLEFTVYDPTSRRIRLVDLQRKVQTIVPTDALAEFTAELKVRAPEVKSAFFMNPQFEKSEGRNKLSLHSKHISYDVNTIAPRHPDAATQYRRFADWICQLNATNTKNLPPFARLELNKAIGSKNVLPQKVQLTLPIGSRKLVLTSEHRYNWLLSRSDREMCETIGGHLADPEMRMVSFEEYRKSEGVTLGRTVSR